MNLNKNHEIITALIALAIGVSFSLIYSYRNGAEHFRNIPKGALQFYSQDEFWDVKLKKKQQITDDTYLFTFELPFPNITLGLQTGQHIVLQAFVKNLTHPSGELVTRKYTPISRMNQTGSFDLLIKIYRPGVNPNYPEGGKLTPYLETLIPGDVVKISGPRGKLRYMQHGDIYIEMENRRQKINSKIIGLIAGGSGITPMLQMIQTILDDHSDPTQIILLLANKSEKDILLKEKLDEATKDLRIKVFYTVDKANVEWKGFTGYISKEMIEKVMPRPSNNVLICTCGPKEMNKIVTQHLAELGHKEENVFKF